MPTASNKNVLYVLLILLGVAGGFGGARILQPTSPVLDENKYPLLDPGAELAALQDPLVRFQPLRESLIAKYSNHPEVHVGLYFEYLPTGANITVNNERAMWPASLIKIPVAMAAMKKIERGEWQLFNQLVILDEDKDASFGNLYLEPTGTTMTIEDLLRATLVDSDNTAHFVLLRNLDAEELEDVFFHLGLDETLLALKNSPTAEGETDNRMTAKIYSIFFRSLFTSSYLSPKNSETFLSFLLESGDEFVRSGLPEGTTFAHKTGIRADEGVWADSGIVYLDRRPFLLTVMIERKESGEANQEVAERIFKEIAQEVYTYVESL